MKAAVLLVLALLITVGAAAQSDSTFTDGRFLVERPNGWTDESSDTLAHFVSPDSAINLYAASVEGSDLSGLLDQIAPELNEGSAAPLQTNEIPLPALTWTQNVYLGEDLIALLTSERDGITYVVLVRGATDAFAAATPAINGVLLGFTLVDETTLSEPAYFTSGAFSESEVTLAGEFAIPCTLTLPQIDAPAPAVIILTGSGSSDRDGTLGANKPYRDLAWGLAANGVASLRCDDRSFALALADLTMSEFTIDSEYTEDALAGLELLRADANIDADRLFVLGHSLGGMLAPRVAAADGDVAGVIMLASPARPFDEMLNLQIAYLNAAEPETDLSGLDGLVGAFVALRAGDAESVPESDRAYLQSLIDYDQVATAVALDLPFLVLQGARDYQVTLDDLELWAEALVPNADATFIAYDDLNHLFHTGEGMQTSIDILARGFVSEEVITDITEWVRAR